MKDTGIKLLSLAMLVAGTFFTSCQKEEKREVFAPSYGEPTPDKFGGSVRRCRVMKRYRPKNEIYRIGVDVNNDLIQYFRDLDSDNDAIFDLVESNNPNPGFNGYITFEFLEPNGKAISCLSPIKLNPIKSQGKNGKGVEFESADFEAKKDGGTFICGSTDHFLYPVNINYYNAQGKLLFVQNTTFNFTSTYDGKGKKEEVFEAGQIFFGPYKAEVEQTEFDVILSSAGAEKLKVVQVLQSELKISEKEAFEIINKLPCVIKAKASKEEANQLKAALEAVGAKVDLK
jgi:ribosomal protein L7/L12